MSLTADQQRAAFAPGSVCVTAGAGTGKTHMLAERYVYHLAEDLSPLQVVAATFTSKAAGELRARIRDRVAGRWPDRPELVAELEVAPISTLHALCTRICQEHPDAAGVPAQFTVLDELEGKLWALDRLDEILDALPGALYAQVPYGLLRAALECCLADPVTAREALAVGADGWPEMIRAEREAALTALMQSEAWREAALTVRRLAGDGADKFEAMRQAAVVALDALSAAVAAGASPEPALEALSQLKINVGSKKAWPEGHLEMAKEAVRELREQVKGALDDGLLTLTLGPADQALEAMLPALGEAFAFAVEKLVTEKTAARVLDFADLEAGALRALANPAVRAYYATRWKAFLIDEFQDTNPVQGQLIAHLTETATLTVVGDVKQSIYGFRRADPTVFEAFSRRIEAAGTPPVVLKASFRTHKALMNGINAVCRPLLGTLAEDLEAARLDAPHAGPHAVTRLMSAEKGVLKPDRQRAEACRLAAEIKALLDSGIEIHDKELGSSRKLAPRDVAVIARTWAPLTLYGEALEAVGLPVALAGGGDLLATREALDGWALIRFLAAPSDNLALAAVLRGPFFALSDRALLKVAQSLPKGAQWYGALAAIPETARAADILHQLLNARRTETPSRVLQLADRLTGYTAVIANLPGATRREADWGGFVAWVRQLEAGGADCFTLARRIRRLLEAEIAVPRPPIEVGDAVALMTVHAAKGLEWPVVVVPDLGKPQPNKGDFVYMDTTLGLALRLTDEEGEALLPAIYTVLRARKRRLDEAEAMRVFYVALTRARDRLLLSAADEKGGLLSSVIEALEAAGVEVTSAPWTAEEAVPPVLPMPKPRDAGARPLLAPVGAGPSELPVTALSDYALCPSKFRYRYIDGHPGTGEGEGLARRVGSLTHVALEFGLTDVESARKHDPTLPLAEVERALALASAFRAHPAFGRFQDPNAEREVAVTLKLGTLRLSGVVDLVGDDYVLDYKTDAVMRPAHHRFQLWAYAKALGKSQAHMAYLAHDHVEDLDGEALGAIAQEAEALLTGIRHGRYVSTPSVEACQHCGFQSVCGEVWKAPS